MAAYRAAADSRRRGPEGEIAEGLVLAAIIERRPSLRARLAKDPTCSSSRGMIELKSGACVAFGALSGDLGRGLDRIGLVVFDKAYNLTEDEVASLAGSQLAVPNSQTIYTSAPPVVDQHPNFRVLAGLRNCFSAPRGRVLSSVAPGAGYLHKFSGIRPSNKFGA